LSVVYAYWGFGILSVAMPNVIMPSIVMLSAIPT
jgi:hypothetical protein